MTDKEMAEEHGFGIGCTVSPTVAWTKGAEFGYNKANEWHYVSKEGFPNKDDIYLIIRSDGLHLGDYCCGGDGDGSGRGYGDGNGRGYGSGDGSGDGDEYGYGDGSGRG